MRTRPEAPSDMTMISSHVRPDAVATSITYYISFSNRKEMTVVSPTIVAGFNVFPFSM